MLAKPTFTAEQGMTLAGIGLAALATGFAYLAIERNDGVPKIGMAALRGVEGLARTQRADAGLRDVLGRRQERL